jgi:hypothetical protein
MERGLGMGTRVELVRELGRRYRGASRIEKGKILDEFVALSGYHRKHAVRLLNRDQSTEARKVTSSRRIYDEAVREALIVLWETADRICSKRLKAGLPDLVEAMERHGRLSLDPVIREKLIQMSPASMDRLLAPIRVTIRGGRRRRQQKDTHIKRRVAVRTFGDWADSAPGYCQADFVLHSGSTAPGHCVHSFVITDVCSGWTEALPLVARDQSLVVEALKSIAEQFPVPLLGVNTDNDSAFINEVVVDYCAGRSLRFTRSRPYRKNDQAWIEQKNGSIIRRFSGYDRFEGLAAAQALARLYRVMCPYVNFFQPSFKLREKTREGAKVRKAYFPPATPCERLLRSEHVPLERKQRLREQRAELDPAELLHAIREAQTKLAAKVASETSRDSEATHTSTEQFLSHLPDLWRDGEVRATHRQPPPTPRTWRTRQDPFESVWATIQGWLKEAPDATAKSLLARLGAQCPGEFSPGQLRTLQRRVRDWRRAIARDLIYASYSPDDAGPDSRVSTLASEEEPSGMLPALD